MGSWKQERSLDQVPFVDQAKPCDLRAPLISEDHIRMLKLYPPGYPDRFSEGLRHEDDGIVHCDIFQVALADTVTQGAALFAALSYEWGPSSLGRTVVCAGQSVPVTNNLYDALRYVRRLTKPRLIWVDFLCINQEDETEKSAQVQRMSKIYGHSHCVSWLGLEQTWSDPTLSLHILSKLSWINQYMKTQSLYPELGSDDGRRIARIYETRPHPNYSNFLDLPWPTIWSNLDMSYSKRLWIVQEIVMARSNEARLGKRRIDMALLSESAVALVTALAFLRRSGPDFDVDVLQRILNLQWPVSLHSTLLNPVLVHSSRLCREAVDHVYGIVAMMDIGRPYPVDYSLSLEEVFTNYAIHCIEASQSLNILISPWRSGAYRTKSIRFLNLMTEKLPSWCPNWAEIFTLCRPLTVALQGRLPERSTQTRIQTERMSRFVLKTRGYSVDTIRLCGPSTNTIKDLINSLEAIFLRTSKHAPHVSTAALSRACGEVLTTSRDSVDPDTTTTTDNEHWGMWLTHRVPFLNDPGMPKEPLVASEQETLAWLDTIVQTRNAGIRLFTTRKSMLGSGLEGIHVGDLLCVLHDCTFPVILRQMGNKGHCKVIGECYVSGLMQDEVMNMGLEERDFLLI